MKKTKGELSRIAKRAAAKRESRKLHEKHSKAGGKAWRETIGPSEYGYVDEIAKNQNIKRENIFHHDGMPDLMAITDEGKIRFYEIKPKTGSKKNQLLNEQQVETIRNLLRNPHIQVNLVKYEKQGKRPVYDPPIEITDSNINQYSAT